MAASMPTFLSQTSNELSERINNILDTFSTSRASDTSQSMVFNNEEEPQPGLINYIRRNTLTDEINPDEQSNIEESTASCYSDPTPQNSAVELSAKEREEERSLQSLKKRLRHVFVVSQNGKPIFSRYGDEEHFVSLMGVMQSLVSLASVAQSDELKFLKAGPSRIVFFHREPLVFIIISHANEGYAALTEQLRYVYYQIISTLTLTRIQQRLESQPNFDLRRWFSHAEKKLMHNIIDFYENDLGLLMKSAPCLMISEKIRYQIGRSITQVLRGQKEMPFALIFTRNRLVCIVRMKRYHLQPSDMYLLMNLINCSEALVGAEFWIPVCLPRFDPGGTFHAHISYLDEACQISLVLLTVNPEHFELLSHCKHRISENLNKHNLIEEITEAYKKPFPLADQIDFNGLRYFVYKSSLYNQVVSSHFSLPYLDSTEKVRLLSEIRYVYGHFHQVYYPLKHFFYRTQFELIFGCLTNKYELYAVFAPSVSDKMIGNAIDRILSYISDEETDLFIFKCECID